MANLYSIVLFATFLSSTYAENVPYFRNDYIYNKEFDAFYKEYHITQNWSEAVAICEAEGAQLLVPISQKEVETVLSMTKNESKIFWTGIHDIYAEGDYVTLDGTSIRNIFTNFEVNEPNNANNEEDCIVFHKTGKYNDVNCRWRYLFVCKKSAVGLTRNDICETYDTAYTYNKVTDHCYKFHTNPVKWHDAYKICNSEESHLAIINSNEEAIYFNELFSKYPTEKLNGNFEKELIFLGFSDLINPGVYKTIQGQFLPDAGYDTWGPNQPDNWNKLEHCGSLFRNGGLNDVNCDNRAMYICEKILSNNTQNVNLYSRNNINSA